MLKDPEKEMQVLDRIARKLMWYNKNMDLQTARMIARRWTRL